MLYQSDFSINLSKISVVSLSLNIHIFKRTPVLWFLIPSVYYFFLKLPIICTIFAHYLYIHQHFLFLFLIISCFTFFFSILEPDILECEVRWPLGSITINKANGGDEIPASTEFTFTTKQIHNWVLFVL